MKNQRNYKRIYVKILDVGSNVMYVMHIFLENIRNMLFFSRMFKIHSTNWKDEPFKQLNDIKYLFILIIFFMVLRRSLNISYNSNCKKKNSDDCLQLYYFELPMFLTLQSYTAWTWPSYIYLFISTLLITVLFKWAGSWKPLFFVSVCLCVWIYM